MFCTNCGRQIPDGSRFCTDCGTPVGQAPAGGQQDQTQATGAPQEERVPAADGNAQGRQISREIILCNDGKYRWVYELSLFKNPTIFLLVWKIFFFVLLGIFAVMMIVDAVEWPGQFAENALNTLKMFGIFIAGMTALVGISYLIYAAINGGKYCVIFEMDEQGINHKQMPRQAKKAQLISALTLLAGLASGRMSTVGASMAAAQTERYSSFATTRKVLSYPRRGLIKVNGLLQHNQVYTAPEDFQFVRDYIMSHCTAAKVKR